MSSSDTMGGLSMCSVFSGSGLACGSVCVLLCIWSSVCVLVSLYLGGDKLSPVMRFVTEVNTGCVCRGGGIVMPLTMSAAVTTGGAMELGSVSSSSISKMPCIWSICSGLVDALSCDVGALCGGASCVWLFICGVGGSFVGDVSGAWCCNACGASDSLSFTLSLTDACIAVGVCSGSVCELSISESHSEFMSNVFLASGGEPVLGVCAAESLFLELCVGVVLLGVGVFGLVVSGVGTVLCAGDVCSFVGPGVGVVVFVVIVVFVLSGCCAGGALVLVLFLDAAGFLVR